MSFLALFKSYREACGKNARKKRHALFHTSVLINICYTDLQYRRNTDETALVLLISISDGLSYRQEIELHEAVTLIMNAI